MNCPVCGERITRVSKAVAKRGPIDPKVIFMNDEPIIARPCGCQISEEQYGEMVRFVPTYPAAGR